jgi:ornithine cyclodeaminase/alanine dehydrogenase-like protein (mu-crystallin family)
MPRVAPRGREVDVALILTRADVEAALPMAACIASQEAAFAAHARGLLQAPERPVIRVEAHGGLYLAMPAYLRAGDEAMAVKVLSFYDRNPARFGLPSIASTILLHDPRDGRLLALLEGASITGLRTAAGSGAATKRLARPDAGVVAILGSGVQAEAHVLAMREVRPVREFRVFSPNAARRAAFAERMAARAGVPVTAAADAEAAVRGADIVCTTSTAAEPIVRAEWLSPGAHVNAVGSGLAHRRELDTETVLRAKIVVDTRHSALSEAGDLLIPIAEGKLDASRIHAELGEVLTGDRPGRTDIREITVFKSVGVGLQDVAAAAAAYAGALERGLGAHVDL